MSEEFQKAVIRIVPGVRPAEVVEATEEMPLPPGPAKETVHTVGKAVSSYLRAAQELLQGEYSHLRDLAARHLREPGRAIVACCPDGVVVRYETSPEGREIVGLWTEDDLTKLAPTLSQNVVYCHSGRPFTSRIPTDAPSLTVSTKDQQGGQEQKIAAFRIGFDIVLQKPDRLPQPPLKPFCALSVQSTFEFHLVGEFLEAHPGHRPQTFVVRSNFRLPVGWDCLEVYPFLHPDDWKPEYAAVWAVNDILRTTVLRQLRETRFHALDPNAVPRARFAALLKEFKALLDSQPEREEILQRYLRDNPILICPTNIGFWPKLELGARQTDFVFREAAGDYLLVELERSTHRLFIGDGQASGELNHACGQILDWKRYLEDNLHTVQTEKGLAGISVNPKSLVVIGRSDTLTPENRRKLTTLENQNPKLKIMTYDDVHETTKALAENLFGRIWETGPNTEVYYLTDGVPAGTQLLPSFL